MSSKTKGVVLISILLIVLILSSVAILFGNKYLLSLKRAQYTEFQIISLNIFRNLESLSKHKIDKELRFNSSKLSKNNPIINSNFIFNVNGADIVSNIKDASNCFNINSLVVYKDDNYYENIKSINALKRFMSLQDIDDNLIDELIDQIIDWIDLDSNPRTYGLENYYYTGPLHSPKEYSGMRLMTSIEELKSIPASNNIDWEIFKNYFCALPMSSDLSLNINTLSQKDAFLLASIYPNIELDDSEYIIENIPLEGFADIINFNTTFPDLDFTMSNGKVLFKSNIFEITTSINFNEYLSESRSIIIYGNNKNSYIFSRIYNGV